MVHHEDPNDGYSDWWKLTPDINGSYVNGSWSQLASLASDYGPLFFGSAVLADGRVLVEGGEQNFSQYVWTNKGAIYDPIANKLDQRKSAQRLEQHRRRLQRRPVQQDAHAGQLLRPPAGAVQFHNPDVDRDRLRQVRLQRRGRLDAAAQRQRADG